ncbi:mechanosensitive ion channel family protein [Aggregicoccus sp. 17bor-14]|uniref:mechanosensitive ion channel family protein n=1 Tax=Myxococcaceae TaxID=31 RepID=UPI00129C7928|nr:MULTISPECIES: mechanosensitive ion channel family protein [Myxococcaceae]MBF5043095.1 mechanosensitive ion channel family protein [Simulacricoccus sp. 17bor-14]MRI88857.1 mechanosensitive ion channel family protein [Aggregicoccus sp. 17bor-14]
MSTFRAPLLLLALVLGAGSAHAQLDESAPPPAPVRFRGEELFRILAPMQGVPPEKRAVNVQARVERLAAGSDEVLEQIHTVEVGGLSGVMAADLVVVGFGAADAQLAGKPRQVLAKEAAERLHAALARDFAARSAKALGRSVLIAVGLTLGLLLLLRVLSRGVRPLERRVRERLDARLARARGKGHLLSLMRADRILLGGLTLARRLLTLGLLVTWVVLVLGLFPWTRGFARASAARLSAAAAWVVAGIASYLPNLFYIAVAALVTWGLLRMVRLASNEVQAGRLTLPRFYPEWAEPTYNIARFFALALFAVVIYPFLPGSGSPAFQGVSVFLGLVLSLGSTAAIANVVAGVVITYMRPFRVSDSIKVGDSMGVVVEKTLLVVRLRTLEGMEITVPNSAILQGQLENFTAATRGTGGLVIETSVTIGYDVPWRTVERLLLTAARRTPDLLESPEPVVWQVGLEDFYVRHTLRVAVKAAQRRKEILAALNRSVLDAFFEAGVEIMSPHYVSARDGNLAAIPPEQRPAGPVRAFRLQQVEAEPARDAARAETSEPRRLEPAAASEPH